MWGSKIPLAVSSEVYRGCGIGIEGAVGARILEESAERTFGNGGGKFIPDDGDGFEESLEWIGAVFELLEVGEAV